METEDVYISIGQLLKSETVVVEERNMRFIGSIVHLWLQSVCGCAVITEHTGVMLHWEPLMSESVCLLRIIRYIKFKDFNLKCVN